MSDGSIPSDTQNLDAVQRALSPVCFAKRWVLICRLVDELALLRAFHRLVIEKVPKSELESWGIHDPLVDRRQGERRRR